jgi:hypothetical protein
MHKALMLHF